ncbi:hypothetical protein KFL_000110445 [Klebsormidium nitens]|uniref:TraB family protein n=1 Tax=Klebsormidium nitens TaxID=105231 RepID=A0A1Y1HP46_KLENI|nr:hypothetical protein KFL_000110445 [Klebsormidium nitens]|eukprot:GAQ78347.1 hypothetical protein KFL_000110445 [Klebsormidium nitens]
MAFVAAFAPRNPYQGSLVYLIGTAHVSKASQDDVRLLIEAVMPDVVAVELDEERLELFECGLMEVVNFAIETTWESLGVSYACDVRSAIHAAAIVGARVLPIDQPTDVTDFRKEGTAQFLKREEPSLNEEERVVRRTAASQLLENQFEAFLNPDHYTKTVAQAFGRIFATFIKGQPAPLDDVEIFQSALNKIVEAARLKGVNGEIVPAFDEKEGPNQYTAVIHERDRFMGLKLANVAAEYTTVVAVVGAVHVPSITARFAQYSTGDYRNPLNKAWAQDVSQETWVDKGRGGAESLLRENALQGGAPEVVGEPGRKQQNLPGEQQKTGREDTSLSLPLLHQAFTFAGAAGASGFVFYKWPIITAELGLGAVTAHGVIMVGLAAFTANWAQLGVYFEDASIELRS